MKAVYENGYAKMKRIKNHPRLMKTLNVARGLFKPNDKLKVLDIGCGDGLFAIELGKVLHTKSLYGTDISNKAVTLSNKNNVETYLIDTDKNKLPFKSGYFDLVFCGSVIEIVDNPDKLLIELNRVVKKKGYVIVTFPNHSAWLSRIAVLFGYLPFYYRLSTKFELGKMFGTTQKGNSSGFIRLFNSNSFKILAQKYGFENIKITGSQENALPRFLKPLDTILSKRPSLAFQVIVLMTKKNKSNYENTIQSM
ncbi:MAG: class I SAM-dependent methyltransferase [Candidatus Roizmanbacteria bacterium]|nr:class I SAM-dependent methyltransferase [Candidatus Roizmanbacteria bacterium]